MHNAHSDAPGKNLGVTFVQKLQKFKIFFFWGGEHPPDATEAFQLLPRRHLSLHHNGKDSLATETGAVEQTPVMWS